MERWKNLLKKNLILAGIVAIVTLIIASSIATWYNKREMTRKARMKEEALAINENMRLIIRGVVQRLDISARGYGVTKDERLLKPLDLAKSDQEVIFKKLDSLFSIPEHQQFKEGALKIKEAVKGYTIWTEQMVAMARMDSMSTFVEMMQEDRGTALWYVYDEFAKPVFEYENAFLAKVEADYNSAANRNLIMQLVLLLLGVPTLISIFYRLRKDERERTLLIQKLDENNRTYLFNPGEKTKNLTAGEAISNSIKNFVQISSFVNKISSGDYLVEWDGLNEKNKALNEGNVTGNLIKMKERLLSIKKEDDLRNWSNEGLAQFSSLLRVHQNNFNRLCDEVIQFLSKYLNAQQGALFVTRHQALELVASFAYNKKKYIEKTIEIGSGLVGQAYLEKDTILLTQVPRGYTHITSGLGDATPSSIIIVPLVYHDEVQGIVELASFKKFEPHERQFLEKAGEFLASALTAVHTTNQMQHLLEQAQKQTEQMRTQEIEMRQNMEELQATQEEMERKRIDAETQIAQLKKELQRFKTQQGDFASS
jgi:putative methionine-R-sulfoxide reductase with GAF domain